MTIRVLVADDQGMVRSGFSILLNAQPDIEVVGEAVNGQEAVARVADGKIAQRVHILDADGEAWEALYTLEQQPDGSLKIVGCVLIKAGQAV